MSFINANALHIPLAPKTVQCVVTSPPYWGLRDYGTARWEGGDAECDHNPQRPDGGDRADRTLPLGRGGLYRDTCGKCGAIRVDNQLGLEPTPEAYVANMVAVFREVWRVMRDDGTLWLNLGDSYAGGGRGRGDNGYAGAKQMTNAGSVYLDAAPVPDGLKPKDLIGIPWRVAFALQADGWYLRSDIIWHKPNPMPESVTDRPTKSHEYIFLLSKSPRYYYDAEAVKEDSNYGGYKDARSYSGKNGGDVEDPKWEGRGTSSRNRRTVWTIPTTPYSGAHFATFPPDLVRPCVLAGSSPRACEICGAPWERAVEKELIVDHVQNHRTDPNKIDGWRLDKLPNERGTNKVTTLGWQPTCSHANEGTGKSIVLDPFSGSGTVVMVAQEYGRRGVGIELNPKYIELALDRTAQARAQMVMGL